MKKILLCVMLIALSLVVACEANTLPSRYDLRDYGRITSVKNQDKLAVCEIFAAFGAMESNYLTQGLDTAGKVPDFSEMHLIYYGSGYADLKTEQIFTTKYSSTLFAITAFCSRLAGPALEKDMKYTSKINKIPKSAAKKIPEDYKIPIRLRDAYFLSMSTDLDDGDVRKKLIMEHGAIVVGFYSDLKKYYNTGKYCTYFNNKEYISHYALLAGWNDDFSRDNFNPKPSKNGAWLVKNSWGTDWGDKGYFWMSYEQSLHRGTAFIVEKFNPNLRHYGYDDLGWCRAANCSWGANVFKIREDKEFLKEVAFYTTVNDVNYEIFVYDLGVEVPNNPVSKNLVAKFNGNMELAGYHTINLPKEIPIKQGEYFSIVLKTSNGKIPIEMKLKKYSENAVTHEKESYFSEDGLKWEDGIGVSGGSNACIKAFTIIKP